MDRLKKNLADMEKVVIAYSGGIDSTLLLRVAVDTLGAENVIAVIAKSDTYPEAEYVQALEHAGSMGLTPITIETKELQDSNFRKNPPDRCYYCKRELFMHLRNIADRSGYIYILDGSNVDDLSDYRPGNRAKEEFGVRSPLQEIGLTKDDIRILSEKLSLPTSNNPATPCLSSRFPYGEEITRHKLKMVENAEIFLHALGFTNLRVRIHKDMARIEVDKGDIPCVTNSTVRAKIVQRLKELGFRYVTLDLEGYRTGSLNEALRI